MLGFFMSFGNMDNLNYTYQANSNKIQAVSDISGETASFTDVTGATDYTYLADASLRSDANKGISLFEYNYLKKPNKITFSDGRTISYQYSASGKKLKETTSTNETTDYVGNVIYKNGAVYQVSHDEGRTVNNVFEYDIKDHLGSLRVSFKDSLGIAKVTQESHTGIFGEVLPSLVYINTPKTDNFDYTGHERLKTFNLGYIDAGARLYDPIVPRFITLDPLAELSRRFSPTVYGNANPIRFIDPDGMKAKGYVSASGYYSSDTGSGGEQDEVKVQEKESEQRADDKDKPKPKANTAAGGLLAAGMQNAATRGGAGIALDGAGVGTALRGLGTGLGYGLVIGGIFYIGTGGFQELVPDIPIADVGTKADDNNSPIFFHYTNNVGYLGIMSSKKILPDVKGNVYITDAAFSSAEAFRDLFLSQDSHMGRGDYVIAFRLSNYKVAQLEFHKSNPFEFIYPNGTLKIDKILYGGINIFQKK